MTSSELQQLIMAGENNLCDFKREFYKYNGVNDGRAEFIKDITAFANSTRQNGKDAFVIVGYKDGSYFDVKLSDIEDDAQWQILVNGKISPPIEFTFEEIEITHEGQEHHLILIKIPVSSRKPHIVRQDFKTVKKTLYEGQCFVRVGSSTAIANRVQIAEMVYDADKNFNPYKRLIKYIESVQKTGEKIDIGAIENLLYQNMIPSFFMPLSQNLDAVSLNSAGVPIHSPSISQADLQRDSLNFNEAADHSNTGDYSLAKTFLDKLSDINKYKEACLVAGVVYTELGDQQKAYSYYERAIELEPDSPEVYYRYARSYLRNKEIGNGILNLEKAYALIDPVEEPILSKVIIYNLATVYYEKDIMKRAKNLMHEFLHIHYEEDEPKLFAQMVINS